MAAIGLGRAHSQGQQRPHFAIAANYIPTAVVPKLPRNQHFGRVILLSLSNLETDHERQRIDSIEQSTAP
jgi:hypothetical protein